YPVAGAGRGGARRRAALVCAQFRGGAVVRRRRRAPAGGEHARGGEDGSGGPAVHRTPPMLRPAKASHAATAASTNTISDRIGASGMIAQASWPWTRALMKPSTKVASTTRKYSTERPARCRTRSTIESTRTMPHSTIPPTISQEEKLLHWMWYE